MSNYQPYSDAELDILLHEPWEVSDQPFMLHAAYALCSLADVCLPEPDEDGDTAGPDDIWGCSIPQNIFNRLVSDVAADFNDAADNRKQVRIWGRSYSIRKVNAYDHKRLEKIFRFPLNNGEYTIVKEGVLNLAGPTPDILKKYEVSIEQVKKNRTYLRQIIMLAEDDEHDGWDKLTDMEIVVYCYALFYNKYQYDNFVQFKNEYKDHLYVTETEIIKCLNEKASLRERPVGMYTFSADKVQEWNRANGQTSVAISIDPSKADDYWYETALNGTFKPIDFR